MHGENLKLNSCFILYYDRDIDHLWAVLNTAINLQVPQKAARVLTSREILDFQERIYVMDKILFFSVIEFLIITS